MLSLSKDNQSDVIESFKSTSRYLGDLLNINNKFFDSMDNRIYPSELQLNKAIPCQMPRPHVWIYIYLNQYVLSRLKYIIIGRQQLHTSSNFISHRYIHI